MIVILLVNAGVNSVFATELDEANATQDWSSFTSSGALVDALPAEMWRTLEPKNTIVMTLPEGEVMIELAPGFAPKHVKNIKTLVSEKYFDGTAIIRSQDNYVAQWGDTTDVDDGNPEVQPKSIGSAEPKLNVEFFRPVESALITPIKSRDAYAAQVGIANGFPVASDGSKTWLAHCYGMVGVSRSSPADSGNGSGLYAVTGHAPRHLDLNVTLVGKVWKGMEHLSSLPRGKGPLGFYTSPDKTIPIEKVRFLNKDQNIYVMRTDTAAFKRYVELRTTRNEEWFLEPTGKIELCNVGIPTRDIL